MQNVKAVIIGERQYTIRLLYLIMLNIINLIIIQNLEIMLLFHT